MKIVVFDSGFGSLSIIKPIQKITKSEIIYFADQENFPYGKKSKSNLSKIIRNTIKGINHKFDPDLIVIGSNTPTLLLNNIINPKIIGVLPPLKEAVKISRTSNIAILATESVVKSKELSQFIKKCRMPEEIWIKKINASPLVELVESGIFLTNKKYCRKIIRNILKNTTKEKIDVMTLSSTHLPFLLPILKKEFPGVTFLDPANNIANNIKKIIKKRKSNKNTLKIFTSGNPKNFHAKLKKIGIKNKVMFFSSN